jgi:uncharacterized protein YecT (DUF1311 family)
MIELAEKIALVVVGALLAGGGYLIKRRIEKKPVIDEIDRRQKLLALNKELAQQKISLQDLDRLEALLLRKTKAAESFAQSLKAEVDAVTDAKGKEFLTQAEMNQRAFDSYQVADSKLRVAIASLAPMLSHEERHALGEAQAAWELYRDAQAQFAAKQFEGGSIAPLIYRTGECYPSPNGFTSERN